MECERTVLLISSDHVGWEAVRTILAAMHGVDMVGEAANFVTARRLAATHTPDLILAEATIAGTSTTSLLAELHRDYCPASKIVMLATYYEPGQLCALDDAGIVGYLLWNDLSCSVLRHALALLLAGDVILGSWEVAVPFLAALRGEGQVRARAAEITPRERAVLGGLATGLTREQVAKTEELSLRTVKRTIADLEQKLDAPNLFLLGMTAAQLGVIRLRSDGLSVPTKWP